MQHYSCLEPIAILLATYNAEKYLKEQIDSLLLQTCQQWALFIRDDGSTDATQVIIDEYLSLYPDKIVQIDKGEPNLGCTGNFLRLLEVVDATYYMFCDQDDIWMPEKVDICYATIKKEENKTPDVPILAFHDSCLCNDNLEVIADSQWKYYNINPYSVLKFDYVAICCIQAGACTIFNKIVRDKILPIVDNRFIYDYFIALYVSRYGRLVVIDIPMRHYRLHSNQVLGLNTGRKSRFIYKFYNIFSIFRQYNQELRLLQQIGYGSAIKYYTMRIKLYLKRKIL